MNSTDRTDRDESFNIVIELDESELAQVAGGSAPSLYSQCSAGTHYKKATIE